MNPLDILMKFFFDNIFFFLCIGFGLVFLFTYLKFGHKIKYKVIDREEVERGKFIEAMRFNKTSKFFALYTGFMVDGGIIAKEGQKLWTNINKMGNIENYLEFEQVPIEIIEREGKITYRVEKDEMPMKLIALIIKKNLFWRIPNPLAKSQPMIIENNGYVYKDEKNKRIVIPEQLGFDRFMGYYYMIGESTKQKLRNILDARVLTTDFSLMASRYFAKSQEQCVYSPELAFQMAQKQTELNIELAKKKGIQQTT